MRIKHPPSTSLGGTIGLCVTLWAFGACAAPDTESPVAGSAAPIASPAPDRAPLAPDDPGRDADAPSEQAAPTADGTDARRAPGATTAGERRGTVSQQPPLGSGAPTVAGSPDDDGRAPAAPAPGAAPAAATTTTTAASAPRNGASRNGAPASTVPGRTSRGGHPSGPGTTSPTTTAAATPTPVTTVATPSTTVAPERPSPPPQPPTTEPPPPAAPVTAPSVDAPSDDVIATALAMVNAARNDAGAPPLVESDALRTAAQSHSLDQAVMQEMTHVGSDGSDPGTRIARAGFEASTWGENVAAGSGSATAIVDGWMGPDRTELANILDATFTAIGFASAESGDGTVYWTMLLAG